MLPLQFFGQNLHFAISLFAALVFFAVFWLYFDAWGNRHEAKELYKWLGFLVVSVSYLAQATTIEPGVLGQELFGGAAGTVALVLRFVGYILILVGVVLDPIQKAPHVEGLQPEAAAGSAGIALGGGPGGLTVWFVPLGAVAVAYMYWRRASKGLERHLRPMAIGMFVVAFSNLAHIAIQWRDSTDPVTQSLAAAFGPVWWSELALLAVGSGLIGKWVWQYLTKRLQSELFMILSATIMTIYLITTVSFTFLLTSSTQSESLHTLHTASSVLNYALDSKKSETKADAEALIAKPDVVAAVQASDHAGLVKLAKDYLESKKVSDVVITSVSGQVLLRASDPDRFGDSLSSDPLVSRALIGSEASGLIQRQGVLAPEVLVSSAAAVRAEGQIVGSVVVSLSADNAFVDGIKSSTGLDSAVYAGNVRSATTFAAADGTSRLIGVKETSSAVKSTVLDHGQVYEGVLSVGGHSFLAIYRPIKDINNDTLGMLFIGQPQALILQEAGRSIELTFLIAVGLLLISILPVFYISRYLSNQLK